MIEIQSLFYYFSDFEQEVGYPKQDARFLDLSFRGICTDDKGIKHNIDKDLITSKHLKYLIDFYIIFLICRSYNTKKK
jgi:hypothetical protein